MTISKPVGMVLHFNNHSSTPLSIKTFLSCFHANKSMAKAHAPPPPQPLYIKLMPHKLSITTFSTTKNKNKKISNIPIPKRKRKKMSCWSADYATKAYLRTLKMVRKSKP